jgi:hypothetical protein
MSRKDTSVFGEDISPGIETEVEEGIPITLGMSVVGIFY